MASTSTAAPQRSQQTSGQSNGRTSCPVSGRANDPSASWTRRAEYVVNRRIITPGTEVSIRGERGRFRFIQAVETSTGALWLDFIGGPAKAEKWRSFRPDRVRRVHRINKTRANVRGTTPRLTRRATA